MLYAAFLFLYSARVYEKITKQKPLYKRKRVKIPVPRFIVLYNGNEPYPEYGEQKLSDSFIFQQENPQLELKIDIYNINYEMNAEIVRRSKSLAEYSQFIGLIKANLVDGLTLEEAIRQAIEYGEKLGEQKERRNLIRKFSKIIELEQIAETLNVPVEYVLSVLNEPTMVCEKETPYVVKEKE